MTSRRLEARVSEMAFPGFSVQSWPETLLLIFFVFFFFISFLVSFVCILLYYFHFIETNEQAKNKKRFAST